MSRIARLAALLEEPLLVAGPPYVLGGQANVRYLTGLQSSNAAVLVEPDGGATLYTDFRYANRARALEGFEVVRDRPRPDARDRRAARGTTNPLRRAESPARAVSSARRCRRRCAGHVGTGGSAPRGQGRGGDRGDAPRERSLRRDLRGALEGALHGSERERACVVGRAELPRGRGGGRLVRGDRRRRRHRRIASRGAWGRPDPGRRSRAHRCRVHRRRLLLGLHSHLCGRRVSERLQELHALCLEAQLAGLAAVAPGVHGRDADAASRTRIEEAGLGWAYGHGMGHGVGTPDPRGAHAAPRVDGCARGRERRLRRARDLSAGRGSAACGSRTSSS